MSRYADTSVIVPMFDATQRWHEAATALWKTAEDVPLVTVNVLGELYVALTRTKGRAGARPLLSHSEAAEQVAHAAMAFDVRDVTAEHWRVAIVAKKRLPQWPIWDALHWAAALSFGCDELLTTDPPGGVPALEGVRFVNPFA